uniref:Recep_L_domain domain-containing protein n=1 Tax=Strongyloides papillosus TaxID=174720 RepID=A0A0N5C9K5_STREA
MFSNVSKQFDVNINGIDCYNNGTGYKISLDELSNLLNKDIGCFLVGGLKITRFETIASNMFFKNNFEEVTVKDGISEVNVKIIKEDVKESVKKIYMDNNYGGILLFISFNLLEGVVGNLYLDEIYILNDFAVASEIFKLEISLVKRALNANLFNCTSFSYLSQENGFCKAVYEKLNSDKNTSELLQTNEGIRTSFCINRYGKSNSTINISNLPQSGGCKEATVCNIYEESDNDKNTSELTETDKNTRTSFCNIYGKFNSSGSVPNSPQMDECIKTLFCNENIPETPRSRRVNNMLDTCTRKRRNLEMHSHSPSCVKKKKLSSESPEILSQHVDKDVYSLQTSDVIRAIEYGIASSKSGEVRIETLRIFLGARKLEFARFLLKLVDRYELIDEFTKIVRK